MSIAEDDSPAPWPAAHGAVDVLAAGPGHAPERRTPRWIAGGVVALAAVLVAGVTYGAQLLSGGGSQPEDALPAGALAFGKVDLDPSAGQKIDAYRFLRKFPALRAELGDGSDLRRVLFAQVADQAGWQEVDFDADVSPWLGERAAVALYPPGDVVAAVQVTDQGDAERGLTTLIEAADGPTRPGFVVTGDYALLAEDQQAAERAANRLSGGTLAADPTFAADLAALGDGVAAAWVDMDAVAESVPGLGGVGMGAGMGLGGLPGAGATGRSTYVLRFDGPNAVEVKGAVSNADAIAGLDRPVVGMTDLPASSAVALGLTGGGELVTSMFDQMGGAFPGEAAERELGIDLPGDAAVLFGTNLVAALAAGESGQGGFEVGARVTTDGERAGKVLDRVRRAAGRHGQPVPIVHRQTDDGVIVATSRGFLDSLAKDGSLGEDEAFRRALPDVEDAGFALWVDFRALTTDVFGRDGTADENIEPIDGLGVTARAGQDGSASYRLRLVVH